jgi:hypothetical protein
MEYDFEVIHLPGISYLLPDALSRFYDDDKRVESGEEIFLKQIQNDRSAVEEFAIQNIELPTEESDLEIQKEPFKRPML